MFTRKDYIALTQAFRETSAECHIDVTLDRPETHEVLYRAAERIADYLIQDNVRFDRQRFLAACEGR